MFCVLGTTDHNWKSNSSIEGHIAESLFDTAHNAFYSKFHNGET